MSDQNRPRREIAEKAGVQKAGKVWLMPGLVGAILTAIPLMLGTGHYFGKLQTRVETLQAELEEAKAKVNDLEKHSQDVSEQLVRVDSDLSSIKESVAQMHVDSEGILTVRGLKLENGVVLLRPTGTGAEFVLQDGTGESLRMTCSDGEAKIELSNDTTDSPHIVEISHAPAKGRAGLVSGLTLEGVLVYRKLDGSIMKLDTEAGAFVPAAAGGE